MLTWSYQAHLHIATRDSPRDLLSFLQTRLSQCMCFVVQPSVGISGATSIDTCALDRPQASLTPRTKLTSLHPKAHLSFARPVQFSEESSSTSSPRSRARLERCACKLPKTHKRPLPLLRLLPRLTKAACIQNKEFSSGRKLACQHLGVIGASLVFLAASCVAADLSVVGTTATQVNAW